MQRRLIQKRNLEVLLSQIEPHPSPKPYLEQYTIPLDLAARILYIAAYTYNDIIDRMVLDLGCGTGRLALGAAFLGAKQVVGVDIDKIAVRVASENSEKIGLKNKVQWIATDIHVVHGKFDTILQNPPFGVQRHGADRKFLEKALETGKTVYSLHKCPHKDKTLIRKLKASGTYTVPVRPSNFIRNLIRKHNGRIRAAYAMLMTIPHMFNFHKKRKHEFVVDLYIIETK